MKLEWDLLDSNFRFPVSGFAGCRVFAMLWRGWGG